MNTPEPDVINDDEAETCDAGFPMPKVDEICPICGASSVELCKGVDNG